MVRMFADWSHVDFRCPSIPAPWSIFPAPPSLPDAAAMLLLFTLFHASVARAAPLDCDEIIDLVERGLPDVAVVSTIQAVGIAQDDAKRAGVAACVADATLDNWVD